MIVELNDQLRGALRLPATRLLICQEDGTPVALAVQMGIGHLRIFRVGDHDFAEQLKSHGIDRTVTVTTVDPSTLMPHGGGHALANHRRPARRQ